MEEKQYFYVLERRTPTLQVFDVSERVAKWRTTMEGSYAIPEPYAKGTEVRYHIGIDIFKGIVVNHFLTYHDALKVKEEYSKNAKLEPQYASFATGSTCINRYRLTQAAHKAFRMPFPNNALTSASMLRSNMHVMEDTKIVWQHPTAEKDHQVWLHFVDVASCLAPVVANDIWYRRNSSKEAALKALHSMIAAINAYDNRPTSTVATVQEPVQEACNREVASSPTGTVTWEEEEPNTSLVSSPQRVEQEEPSRSLFSSPQRVEPDAELVAAIGSIIEAPESVLGEPPTKKRRTGDVE